MRKLLGAVALVAMLVMPGSVEAQLSIGGVGAYHTDAEAIGVGAFATIALPQLHENLSIKPDFVFFFPDGFDYWELNGDLIYSFPVSEDSPVLPFGMAGINISHTSVTVSGGGFSASASSTDVGLNLGGGVSFPSASVRPSVGAKFEIQDGTGFVIFGAVSFPVGD